MLPLSDSGPALGRFPFWVLAIIALNIFVFYLELTSPDPEVFFIKYSLIPALVDFSKPQTLFPFISSQFLHAGFLHILSNMWFLWIFGDNVEDRLGFLWFPLFYLFSGVAGAIVQYSFNPSGEIPMLGASGAVAGILGAYLALFPGNKVKTLVFIFFFVSIIEISTSVILFYWFIIQLFSGALAVSPLATEAGGVAYFAHVGGFALGWIVGKGLYRFGGYLSFFAKWLRGCGR